MGLKVPEQSLQDGFRCFTSPQPVPAFILAVKLKVRRGSVVINNSSSWVQTSPWHIFCSPTQNCRSSAGVDGVGWPQAVSLGAAPLMDMLLDPDPMADSFLHIPNLSCSDGLHCIKLNSFLPNYFLDKIWLGS